MIRCPQCLADTSDKSRFCRQYGARLAIACPACGAVSEPDRFCDACGSPRAPTMPTGPGARALASEQYTPRHLAERFLTARAAVERCPIRRR